MAVRPSFPFPQSAAGRGWRGCRRKHLGFLCVRQYCCTFSV
nr:MAG TPA: hypothetical protein [Caudoviricetes sp.]